MITTKTTAAALVEHAIKQIVTLSIAECKAAREQRGTLIVDIRDVRELYTHGCIPGSVHMPRGMLEFWFDSQNPYYAEQSLAQAERVIFYCAAGARSALATLAMQDMGVTEVAHLQGGFNAWLEAGETIVAYHKEQRG